MNIAEKFTVSFYDQARDTVAPWWSRFMLDWYVSGIHTKMLRSEYIAQYGVTTSAPFLAHFESEEAFTMFILKYT